ncbi:hypothetical protein GLW20_20780 [Virgibacillus halodenitrificans]|jgi:hypothetical protein|nr:hypothetical protein [Virgibacillus halodenitrificans]
MNKFSRGSITLILFAFILLLVNWSIIQFSEPISLIAYLLLFVSGILGIVAFLRKETGFLKGSCLLCIAAILFFISWFKPLEITRVTTWLQKII